MYRLLIGTRCHISGVALVIPFVSVGTLVSPRLREMIQLGMICFAVFFFFFSG